MIDLTGQDILVIGGSSGIGRATAVMADALGGRVTIASRSHDKVEAAAKSNPGLLGRTVDVMSDDSVAALFAQTTAWDHVIVTGSEVRMAAVRELSIEAARAAVDSKFWGFYRVARYADIKPGGSLSVVAGFLATRPAATRALMGAINGALESLVQGLALELKPVRVNAVSPAVVQTEMWNGLEADARQAMFDKLATHYPAGVVGRPEDIARQLLLLAATPYATGTVVTLDGGASIA
ncbi:SDR family oxidoreductase [Brevundimonas sp. SPF441]|uniref:SDR family oxidoreductase n=1 Tax=Brevundimonas sp. SPF441 TaxID=2663795 RepID=UPI00129D3865|nr:SDR family oxidoreductase [Brevundimonas sp. SPF441]MRL70398.1 SDR family oxidoreductase [Brevundimonas sp. SPF441]